MASVRMVQQHSINQVRKVMDKATELAVNEMVKKYDPHTVIVYGLKSERKVTAGK